MRLGFIALLLLGASLFKRLFTRRGRAFILRSCYAVLSL
jgi:hypothetical protein